MSQYLSGPGDLKMCKKTFHRGGYLLCSSLYHSSYMVLLLGETFLGPKFYSVSSFLPRDAKLFVSWFLLRIGASFLTVLLGNALDAFCHRVTHRSSGIHLLHMPQRDTLLFGCKAKLRTADIGLNVFFPLAEVRTELGKRKTFRAFWTIVAYRVASGAADAGKNCAGNPTSEWIVASGFRLMKIR